MLTIILKTALVGQEAHRVWTDLKRNGYRPEDKQCEN